MEQAYTWGRLINDILQGDVLENLGILFLLFQYLSTVSWSRIVISPIKRRNIIFISIPIVCEIHLALYGYKN